MDERRRFSERQRSVLFRLARGRCQRCGDLLPAGWHADHVQPHVIGGPTELSNGQALCPTCNLKKGSEVQDKVVLRPFQEEMADVILDRVAAEQKVTVAWVNAGSGKSLGWMHVANQLYREGLIVGVMVLVPRTNLRDQAETDWSVDPGFMHLYAEPRMGPVVARENRPPLTEPRHFGYITTYASLTSRPGMHLDWAKERAGKFLLVCDEAQYLGMARRSGDDEEIGGGTQAAASVSDLIDLSRHAVLMTGTPYRSDRSPLVHARYETKDGRRLLIHDIRATYRQGVAGGYLRPVQFDLTGGEGEFTDGSQFRIEDLEERLSRVLWNDNTWQPLADKVIARLRDVRRTDRRYKALITAAGIPHAGKITNYLKRQYPSLRVVKATGDDRDAKDVLRNFREGHGDVLVTVQMAYIGYDCKQITVVGLLNALRWSGNLEQTVARGTRIWSERPVKEQTCYVIGPADPDLRKFAEAMRNESNEGVRERECSASTTSREAPGQGDDVNVRKVALGDEVVYGFDPSGDISDPVQLAQIKRFREQLDLVDSESKLQSFLTLFGGEQEAEPTPNTTTVTVETEEQARKRLSNECSSLVSKYIRRYHQINSKEHGAEFRRLVKHYQTQLNREDRVSSATRASVEQLEARKRRLEGWLDGLL